MILSCPSASSHLPASRYLKNFERKESRHLDVTSICWKVSAASVSSNPSTRKNEYSVSAESTISISNHCAKRFWPMSWFTPPCTSAIAWLVLSSSATATKSLLQPCGLALPLNRPISRSKTSPKSMPPCKARRCRTYLQILDTDTPSCSRKPRALEGFQSKSS